jgi:hypothetical protein
VCKPRVPQSYRVRIRGEELESAPLGGLCILSYGVAVQFRELSYVRGELWSALKKYIARNVFAAKLKEHPTEAVVVRVATSPKAEVETKVRLLLQSALYDDVLRPNGAATKRLKMPLASMPCTAPGASLVPTRRANYASTWISNWSRRD